MGSGQHFFFLYQCWTVSFFFQAEDGIRDPLWSRGLGDVYKRQGLLEREWVVETLLCKLPERDQKKERDRGTVRGPRQTGRFKETGL